MHIKEYRIALPMSVEEYRIAQLYMIQKKSRNESSGSDSGVEILVNEPYTDGPGGNGQYTYKIYHIGSHLPGWFRAILPKSALRVEEEAWNAYPYTKTIFRCPFIEKFVLEIETRYYNDGGTRDNVFSLSETEKRNRNVDFIDIVKDQISSSDYTKEEDPKIYKSTKTGRGPLADNWREEYIKASNVPSSNKKIMCAYKLCKVEFRYWGMQNKIERFIHDIGLRKTMVNAHRQAWTWQDEWYGLELEDIRRLERETQELLAQKMGDPLAIEEVSDQETPNATRKSNGRNSFSELANETITENGNGDADAGSMSQKGAERRTTWSSSGRRSTLGSRNSAKSVSEADWRIEKLETLQDESSDDESDLFFDAYETLEEDIFPPMSLARNNSCDILSCENDELASSEEFNDAISCDEQLSKSDSFIIMKKTVEFKKEDQVQTFEVENGSSVGTCKTTVLFLVLHGGSILDVGSEQNSKHADISTLRATFDSVVKSHYPHISGNISVRLVPCPAICSDTINTLISISPFTHDAQSSEKSLANHEFFPLAAIPLLFTSSPDYQDILCNVVSKANSVYNEFIKSEDGMGFSGQVCLIGDSVGGMLGYDALCQSASNLGISGSQSGSQTSLLDLDTFDYTAPKHSNLTTIQQLSFSNPDLANTGNEAPIIERPRMKSEAVLPDIDIMRENRRLSPVPNYRQSSPSPVNTRRTSTNSSVADAQKFDFDVTDFFMFGSPLALVLTHRRIANGMRNGMLKRPICHQMYNLFHLTDPSAARLEPLVEDKFRNIGPVEIPRYQKFPLGDGQSSHVVETIQSHSHLFSDDSAQCSLLRRESSTSIMSQMSGMDIPVSSLAAVINKWWGMKRIDYALYTPEALNSFPHNSLPDLFHARYWESQDVVAFILRQLVRHNTLNLNSDSGRNVAVFQPTRAREKWLHRKTAIKVRNVASNHRANDVLVLEDKPQVLSARFMYGPFDVVALSGEKVDVHIMTQPPAGEWEFFDTATTDSHGRVSYTIRMEKRLSQGMYPVKMVVRGDHTCVDFFLTVLPPHTESAVFSIDGSFTASMSIMGRDPKVRAGAVDVVRHWQELGYLILYISARPDMQHKKVVTWLAQHNFPHGMVAFMEGISADPIRQKALYLKSLKEEANIEIQAAYGSAKDILVYQSLGLTADKIFIVGKASKKQASQARLLMDGYAAHLTDLTSSGGSRSAKGNARFFLRKSCFGLPGQLKSKKKVQAKRCNSYPATTGLEVSKNSAAKSHSSYPAIGISQSGNTKVDAGQLGGTGAAVRPRGASPRPKLLR